MPARASARASSAPRPAVDDARRAARRRRERRHGSARASRPSRPCAVPLAMSRRRRPARRARRSVAPAGVEHAGAWRPAISSVVRAEARGDAARHDVGVDVQQRVRPAAHPEARHDRARSPARAAGRRSAGIGVRGRLADESEVDARPPAVDASAGAIARRASRASAPVRPTARHAGGAERRDEPRVERGRPARPRRCRASAASVTRRPSTLLRRDPPARAAPRRSRARRHGRRRAVRRRRARRTPAAARAAAAGLEQLAAELEDEPRRHQSSARPLVEAERHVEVLHRLARRSLDEVVEARDDARAGVASDRTRQPMSQKFVCATCLISGRSRAGEPHERRVRVGGRVRRGYGIARRAAGVSARVDGLEDAAVERHAGAART